MISPLKQPAKSTLKNKRIRKLKREEKKILCNEANRVR